jgi:nucleotide-binding universal stress UspA family protein
LTPDEHEEVRLAAREALDALLEKSKAHGAIPELGLLDADTIEEGLTTEAASEKADAIVVGRRAKRGEAPIVRLGPVARRLLRTLPTTVVVSPPDIGERGSGDGPVMLATDMDDHSVGAAKFAKELAEILGRPLMVVHVVPTVSFAVDYLGQKYDALTKASEQNHAPRLREWAKDNGLEQAALVTLHGEPVREIAKAALAHDAAIVVTGSRRLSTSERMFEHSLGSELAAACWAPTAVVPSE